MSEPTGTDWAVLWPGDDDQPDSYERGTEDRARRVAAAYTDARLVRRTVTYGPWVLDEEGET